VRTYSVSQKTGPIQLISHNFTNSQYSLIIFGKERYFNSPLTTIKSFYIGLEPAVWFP